MASFSQRVKDEIVKANFSDIESKALLKGLLQINAAIDLSSEGLSLEYKTKNENVANKIIELVQKMYKVEPILMTTKEVRLKKETVYIIRINQNASFILRNLSIMQAKNDTSYSLKKDLESDEEKIAYIKGAFLSTGSVNDPSSSIYHLEIQTFNSIVASNLKDLINSFGLTSKISKNRRGFIVYLKSADRIQDFLQILGTNDSLLYYADLLIENDMNNSINRVMNCEIANQKKATQAALRQVEEIQGIEKTYDIKELPKSVIEAMKLRKDNPEDSLQELSDKSEALFGHVISRSALNHRFKAIHELYKEKFGEWVLNI